MVLPFLSVIVTAAPNEGCCLGNEFEASQALAKKPSVRSSLLANKACNIAVRDGTAFVGIRHGFIFRDRGMGDFMVPVSADSSNRFYQPSFT